MSKNSWPNILANHKFILRLERPATIEQVFEFIASYFTFQITHLMDTAFISEQDAKRHSAPTLQIFQVVAEREKTSDVHNLQQRLQSVNESKSLKIHCLMVQIRPLIP